MRTLGHWLTNARFCIIGATVCRVRGCYPSGIAVPDVCGRCYSPQRLGS